MSLSCLAFVMFSRVPNVLVSIAVSSIIPNSFTVEALLSFVHLLSRSLFSVAGVSVFICFYLIVHAELDNFSNLLQPLLTSLSAWTFLPHCIIITRVSPFIV